MMKIEDPMQEFIDSIGQAIEDFEEPLTRYSEDLSEHIALYLYHEGFIAFPIIDEESILQ